jgi:hypothetical protein
MVVVVEVQLLLEQLLLDLKQAQVELEQRLQLMELQLLEQEEVVVDHRWSWRFRNSCNKVQISIKYDKYN